jgi:mono/diheme cytochrome c family protein
VATPARVERGRYLFENLADCNGCHSERDYRRLGGPVVPGGCGKGAVIRAGEGAPGFIVAPNITPDPETGLGRWTDGEKIRAIREGVGRDGRALFPFMPYVNYRSISDRDVQSLVANLNSLPPIRNPLPRSRINPLVLAYVRIWPQPAGTVVEPDRSDALRYGEYLATMASCVDCHSPLKRGRPVEGQLFAGGRSFGVGHPRIRSPNITPDAASGIGKWSEQDFLDRFYFYKRYVNGGGPPIGPAGFSPMPWLGLSQLAPEDLRAIYAYLRSQRAIHRVIRR